MRTADGRGEPTRPTPRHLDAYDPRSMVFAGRWDIGRANLKLYTITATRELIEPETVAITRQTVEVDGSAEGPGFVILHRGEVAFWLLLHWWLPGGILAEKLWSSPLAGPIRFESRDRPLMACVWELVPIAFERDSYVRTVMSGRSVDEYLTQTLPDGSY